MSSRPDRNQERLRAIRDDNVKLLAGFSNWLSDTQLSKKAIRQHVEDVELFINMLSDRTITARCGVSWIGTFLGRKALGANPNALLEHAASLKEFYTYLNEDGKTSDEELQEVKKAIKIGMPGWLARVGFRSSEDTEPPTM